MKIVAVRLDAADDVATALREIKTGEVVSVFGPGDTGRLHASERIPAFHKIALRALTAGAPVRKYGAVIGELTAPVSAGGLVHIHNMRSLRAQPPPAGPRPGGADP